MKWNGPIGEGRVTWLQVNDVTPHLHTDTQL